MASEVPTNNHEDSMALLGLGGFEWTLRPGVTARGCGGWSFWGLLNQGPLYLNMCLLQVHVHLCVYI